MNANEIVITEYNPAWLALFEEIASRVRRVLPPEILAGIEHVGSTAVPYLAAKPIVDLIVVISSTEQLRQAVDGLARLGYVHEGDLGITGRDAFRWPPESTLHHLYVCAQDSQPLRDLTLFRDYLCTHDDEAKRYEDLKRELAERFRLDRRAYPEGKTEFVSTALEKARKELCQRT